MRDIHEKIKPTLNKVLGFFLLIAIAFSIITIVQATTPDPGHLYTESSGGVALGDIIYGSGTDTLLKLSGAAGFLKSTGAAAPAWSAVSLTADVGASILPVANGGTGVATLGDAGVLIGNITGAVQVTTAGSAGQVLTSNGAGVDPTFQAAAGGNDPRLIMDALTTGEQHNVTASTALTEVTALSQTLSAGTYTFRYYVIYQANQLTEGIRLAVNYTGTNGAFVWNWRWADLAATASTAVPDQDDVDAVGNVTGTFQSRAKSTTTRGVTLSVDTINSDMFIIIEGVFVATGAGDLELWHGSETATASYTTSVMIGTSVEIHKTK